MCVCVCVRAIASQRKGIPESTTRVCVVAGLRFTGGAETKNPRVIESGLCLQRGGGICAGGRTSKTNTRRIDLGHCFGAGGGENKKPLSIGQSTGGDGRRRLEYLNQNVKQRLVLSAQSGLDDCGSKMLAAAISRQKSTGRNRLGALRAMCTSFGGSTPREGFPANGRTAVSALSRSF